MQRQTRQGSATGTPKTACRAAAPGAAAAQSSAGAAAGLVSATRGAVSSAAAGLVFGTSRVASRAAALLLALFCLLAPFAVRGQTTVKSIEGKVLSSAAAPLAGSVVYLQDTRSNVIKTLIAPADGGYHFGQLPADTDYQIWAEYKGKKSKVRLISSFDTKRNVTHDFHIGDK